MTIYFLDRNGGRDNCDGLGDNQDVGRQNYWNARQSYQLRGQTIGRLAKVINFADKTTGRLAKVINVGDKTIETLAKVINVGDKTIGTPAKVTNVGDKTTGKLTKIINVGDKTIGTPAKVMNFADITRKPQRRQIGGTNPLPRRISESNGMQ